jgi:phospholipid/cholesterol/gamma-HCH transport system substrate-binding protein
MSRRTEIQVGLTVLVALGLLLWGVTWLKELSLSGKHRIWLVRFEQTGGLSSSDEVQVNGIRKGSVEDVHLVDGAVLVHLALDTDVKLTRDCRVSIRNVGLMGEKVIAVDLRMTGEAYTDRDTIPGIYELGVAEVMAALGDVVGPIGDLSVQLHGIAASMNRTGDLTATARNLRLASEQLRAAVEENRRGVKQVVENLQATSATARALTTDREAQLKKAIDHFASAAEKIDQLSGRLDSLRATIQSVSSKVDRGQGTLGHLVNDDKMYEETRAAVAELKALVADIRANPKKYLTVKVF